MIKRRVPGALDLRAHLVEEIREVARLPVRCAAPSITVVPSASTAAIITLSVPRTVGPNLPHKLIDGAGQFRRENLDVAVFHPDRGAERLKSFQMQIDRAIADDAAARQRNGRFLATA